jgi:hypothetical protein
VPEPKLNQFSNFTGAAYAKLRRGWGRRNLTAAASVYEGEAFLCGDSFSR